MTRQRGIGDGLCQALITMQARQLPATVCVQGGADCPLLGKQQAQDILHRLKQDPTVTIRLESRADELPHYEDLEPDCHADPEEVLNRKRDLDVLQRLGLVPGSIRRARYLYELLFRRVETPYGLCAYDTPGWEGCPLARSGAYESVREQGWQAMVYARPQEEMAEYRRRSAERIANGERLYIRSHHLMCLACWYAGGKGQEPRPNDTIYEALRRIQRDPEVPITLVEGCCEVCNCCDGFHPETSRCVHAGGLIRDYKKDLDVFQKLGLMPGATLPAREVFDLLFERIQSTTEICGYGDDVVMSQEWTICGGPGGNPGYVATRRTGVF